MRSVLPSLLSLISLFSCSSYNLLNGITRKIIFHHSAADSWDIVLLCYSVAWEFIITKVCGKNIIVFVH